MKKGTIYLVLHLLLLVFSFGPVCSKLAGRYPAFSQPFLLFYGLLVVILGVYAIGWQQVIKRMPLSAAYANRAITVVWGMVWGAVLFGERASLQQLIGAAVIIAGVVLYAFAGRGEGEGRRDA